MPAERRSIKSGLDPVLIGRKIIQCQTDEDVTFSVSRTQGSKAGLLIDTQGAEMRDRPQALKERTNISNTLTIPHVSVSGFTPNTSYTFGIPNPTTVLSPLSSTSDDSGRQSRYSQAEEALATSLQHCHQEPSSQELQIRVLEKATALLSASVKDAQERAAKLRLSLADREVEPEIYESLQRERWMEEKRHAIVDEEVKSARGKISSLKSIIPASSPSERDSEARKQANLVMFLTRSPTKTSISPRGLSPTHLDLSPKRMTMSNVTPMQARTSSVTAALLQPLKTPISLSRKRNSAHIGGERPLRTSNKQLSPLEIVSEDTSANYFPPSPVSTTVPSLDGMQTPVSALSPNLMLLDDLEDEGYVLRGSGIARIYAPATRRSTADILAQSSPNITLPDYALNLMEHLNTIPDSVALEYSLKTPKPYRIEEDDFESESVASLVMHSRSPSPLHFPSLPSEQASSLVNPRISESSMASHAKKRWSLLKRPQHRPMTSLVSIPEIPSHRSSSPSPGRRRSQTMTMQPGLLLSSDRPSAVSLDIQRDMGVAAKFKRRISRLGRR